jgi:hypothetical protein
MDLRIDTEICQVFKGDAPSDCKFVQGLPISAAQLYDVKMVSMSRMRVSMKGYEPVLE